MNFLTNPNGRQFISSLIGGNPQPVMPDSIRHLAGSQHSLGALTFNPKTNQRELDVSRLDKAFKQVIQNQNSLAFSKVASHKSLREQGVICFGDVCQLTDSFLQKLKSIPEIDKEGLHLMALVLFSESLPGHWGKHEMLEALVKRVNQENRGYEFLSLLSVVYSGVESLIRVYQLLHQSLPDWMREYNASYFQNVLARYNIYVSGELDCFGLLDLPDWLRSLFAFIPATGPEGFLMGSEDGGCNEKPVHEVILSAFYMMNVTVTNEFYERVTGKKSPSPEGFDGPDQPVVSISWVQAKAFADKLAELCTEYDPRFKDQYKIDLPSEAQWEYAAKAGNVSRVYGTDTGWINHQNANYGTVKKTTVGVKEYAPNPWGLYQMSGNVFELCLDWYSETFYANSPVINPVNLTRKNWRAFRGGSWYYNDYFARSAYRVGNLPGSIDCNIGFRLLLAPKT